MKNYEWVRLMGVVTGAALIVVFLTMGNLSTKSVEINTSSVFNLRDFGNDLYLLWPGWQIDQSGPRLIYRATLNLTGMDGFSGLYIPRANDVTLRINQSDVEVFQDDSHLIYWLNEKDINGPLSIEITIPSNTNETYSTAQVYLGNYQAIMKAGRHESILRIFIVGLSFTIILFSTSLFLQKSSEKYLLPLAFMVYTTLGYILLNTFPALQEIGWINFILLGVIKPPFLSMEICRQIHQILFPLLVSFLNFLMLKNFVSVKIGRVDYYYLILPVIVAMFIFINHPIFPYLPLVYRLYINVLECVIIIKGHYKHRSDSMILLAGCTGTIGFNVFITGCGLGMIPHGNMDLLYKLGGISASFYAIAFTVAINGIFARKYSEAEMLAVKLDDINKNLQWVVSERTAELEQAYLRLEAEQQQKDVFVTNMMHSLKTPLFSATGYADMAQEALKSAPERTGHFLNLINTNLDYVVKLVNNLFIALRLESHQVNFIVEKVSLSKVIEQIFNTSLIQTQQKNIRLNISTPFTPVLIDCDPHYLTIAIQNIVDNAIRHTPHNGEIWLSLQETDQRVNIVIKDNGEGMMEQVQNHIFERYYSYTSAGNSSSGIGLTISNDIVTAFNGMIRVVSSVGNGTEFTIDLPKEYEIKAA